VTAPTVDVEVTALQGVDLEGAPPCDMKTGWRLFGLLGRWVYRMCGRPSTHRVKVTCPEHGTRLRFVCERHLRFLKWGWATCWSCDNRNAVRFGGYT
jgi:hypothetical protein